jgi:hypothetical protein
MNALRVGEVRRVGERLSARVDARGGGRGRDDILIMNAIFADRYLLLRMRSQTLSTHRRTDLFVTRL